MKELVSAIENGLKKISKGNITRIELEETVASSRELYERLLIVRYKVYENSILAVEESEELEVVDKETEVKKEEETIPEENKDLEFFFEDTAKDKSDETIIRFDLFATPEIESEEKVLPSAEPDEAILPKENTPTFDLIKEDLQEEVLEKEIIAALKEIENTAIDSAETSKEFKEIAEDASDLFPKLMKIEKAITQNYQVMTLETLIGSFTLNERLQFINELFDGSSDLFSSAIKRLDALDNRDSARSVIAEYAAENNWDLDGEVVEDFMLKICSRYAANLGN